MVVFALAMAVAASPGCDEPPPPGEGDGGSTLPDSASVDTALADVLDVGDLVDVSDAPDVADGTLICPGGAGCPCLDAADCDDNLCLETPAGRVCAGRCVDSCPTGRSCLNVTGGPDARSYCVPSWGLLCRPCHANAACDVPGLNHTACVAHGDAGGFCGVACGGDASCPDGYRCAGAKDVDGASVKQCVPKGSGPGDMGACACSPRATALALTTTCWLAETTAGGQQRKCKGERVCGVSGLSDCAKLTGAGAQCFDDQCAGQPDGDPCDDGDPCTDKDVCASGVCEGGALVCACTGDTDCADKKVGGPANLCTASWYCDKSGGAPVCKENPATGVSCSTAKDTVCLLNQCVPKTGACVLTPVPAGTACDDGDACTADDVCDGQGGCSGATEICCTSTADCASQEDGKPCNGTLYCDKSNGAGTCKVNPATIVTCLAKDDTACRKNSCDDATGACAMQDVPDATPCDDGQVCTAGDACVKGGCKPGKLVCPCQTDADCVGKDDGDVCNGTSFCDASTSSCTHNPATVVLCSTADDTDCVKSVCHPLTGVCAPAPVTQTNAPCDDGDACTAGETCVKGACTAVPAAFVCACTKDADCAAKEDGDVCNGTLFCNVAAGACQVNPATVLSCPSVDDTACLANLCQPKTGACKQTAAPEGKGCDADGNPCTVNDACKGGVCQPGTQVCVCQSDADCAAKEDGNVCNGTLYCDKSGAKPACVVNAATVKSCPTVMDTACVKNTCQPLTGACKPMVSADGVPCDDGLACSKGDQCLQGVCVGGAGACPCTSDGDCVKFEDSEVCTTALCDKAKGCVLQANKADCDDGDPCTVASKCKSGKCGAGVKKGCDDGNPCTDDSCDAAKGCVSLPNAATCSDGDVCTSADKCKGGACKGGGVPTCDDANPCTDDSCDPAKGCVSLPNAATCSDGDACTSADKCKGGACKGGGVPTCDDANPCTDDSCDPAKGCVSLPNAATCSDGDVCTSADKCKGGACKGGGAPTCDDGNPCTDDSCDAAKGCVSLPNAATCDDADLCTADDTCKSKKCVGGPFVTCSQHTGVCVDVACSPTKGCQYHNRPKQPCSDGDFCTSGDACVDMKCVGSTQTSCDDGNACTVDSCDKAAKQCVHKNSSGPCDDGNPCTSKSACSGGACKQVALTCPASTWPCHVSSCDTKTGACALEVAVDGASCGGKHDVCAQGACLRKVQGQTWAKVPAGTFHMGCNKALDAACRSNESPQHPVTLSKAFWLSRDPVTVAEYDACVQAGACPPAETGFAGGNSDASCLSSWNNWTVSGPKPGREGHPANCVVVAKARSYCKWVGGGLPTEAQWELAARGRCDENGGSAGCATKMRIYPWGNTAPVCKQHAVFPLKGVPGCGSPGTWAVGAGSPGGAGPYGHRDLSGNVWEYVEDYGDESTPYPSSGPVTDPVVTKKANQRVRGGATDHVASDLRASYRGSVGQGFAGTIFGFRCAVEVTCDDGDPCTADTGTPGSCKHGPSPGGEPCDDGKACTTGDQCALGKCVGGTQKSCDDGNACTDDSCDEVAGCVHKANNADCSDGAVCSSGTCDAGRCALHLGPLFLKTWDDLADLSEAPLVVVPLSGGDVLTAGALKGSSSWRVWGVGPTGAQKWTRTHLADASHPTHATLVRAGLPDGDGAVVFGDVSGHVFMQRLDALGLERAPVVTLTSGKGVDNVQDVCRHADGTFSLVGATKASSASPQPFFARVTPDGEVASWTTWSGAVALQEPGASALSYRPHASVACFADRVVVAVHNASTCDVRELDLSGQLLRAHSVASPKGQGGCRSVARTGAATWAALGVYSGGTDQDFVLYRGELGSATVTAQTYNPPLVSGVNDWGIVGYGDGDVVTVGYYDSLAGLVVSRLGATSKPRWAWQRLKTSQASFHPLSVAVTDNGDVLVAGAELDLAKPGKGKRFLQRLNKFGHGSCAQSGTCWKQKAACDDGKPCTLDWCDPTKGCASTAEDTLSCETPCSAGGACKSGVCAGAKPMDCDDKSPCTVDSCDADVGGCLHVPLSYGACCKAVGGTAGGVCAWTDDAKRAWGLVPDGTFHMGCNATLDKQCLSKESPQHPATVTRPFWLLTDEVTVDDYQACVLAKGCSAPTTTDSKGYGCGGDKGNNWGPTGPKPGRGGHPVNCVSWEQARDYCAWTGGRLPTEAEWELAARGRCEENGGLATCAAKMRTYPWGNTPPVCKTHAVTDGGCGAGTTWKVGAGSPAGAGPYGHRDLGGNVFEWVADRAHHGFYGEPGATLPDPQNLEVTKGSARVLRGGSFVYGADNTRASLRGDWWAESANASWGIRCARPVAPCDDGNPCTVDAEGTGGCTHAPVADGSACPSGGTCSGGLCLTPIVTLVGGGNNVCVQRKDQSVACWGHNGDQLPGPDKLAQATAVAVPELAGRDQVSLGSGHLLARYGGGRVTAHGYNEFGQLGDGATANLATPTSVPKLSDAASVVAGWFGSCAIRADGGVRCWGDNSQGQLGKGAPAKVLSPTEVQALSPAKALGIGRHHVCAVQTGGLVVCLGSNTDGRLGVSGTQDTAAPKPVVGLTAATAIAAGKAHSCALRSDGTVRCWGQNSAGQLGDTTTSAKSGSVAVVGVTQAVGVVVGDTHSCALKADGSVWCWGDNTKGQLGDGTKTSRATAAAVKGLSDATQLAGSFGHTCALRSEGSVVCWGSGQYGVLGNGKTEDQSTPVSVLGL